MIRGRDPVLELLRDLIVHQSVGSPRPAAEDPDTRRPYVPILVGPGGCGRTALLTELAHQLHDQPHVILDSSRMTDAVEPPAILDLLTTIAFELVRRGDRGWNFSRYIVGRLVIEMPLHPTDPARARTQVLDELARVRNPEALGKWLSSLLRFLPAINRATDGAVEQVIRLIVSALRRWPLSRRVMLRPGVDWYGHRDRKRNRHPISELVILNRMAKRNNEDDQAEVAQVLMEAFLADVRNEAARRKRTLKPVLLLDNADCEPAVAFLRALNAIRAAPGGNRTPDHLTVIAASNGTLLAELGIPDDVQPLNDAGIDKLYSGRTDSPTGPWLPLTLRDLGYTEIEQMGDDIGLSPAPRLVRAVFGLTAGHPQGSHLLLRAAAATGFEIVDLEKLLGKCVPDTQDVPVSKLILDSMLRPLTEPQRGDLITCAAARTREEAESLAASDLLVTDVRDRVAMLSRTYWPARNHDGKPVMHPLLRRLLLRELAERGGEHRCRWATTFGWLRDNVSGWHGELDWIHHALALGEVESVATELINLLYHRGGEYWIRQVTSLMTIAVPALETGANSPAQPDRTGDRQDPVATLMRLLVAWQAVNDPLVTTDRADRHAEVAIGLETKAVTDLARTGLAALVHEADKHRKMARLWRGESGSGRTVQ